MKRKLVMLLAALVIVLGFTGCEEVLDALGLGSSMKIDLAVEITFTNSDSVIVKITNAGTDTASNVLYNLYLTTGTDVQPNDYLVFNDFVDVPPKSTEQVEVAFAAFEVPDTVDDGNYRVGVIVDPGNTIAESDDNNNKATSVDTYQYTGGGTPPPDGLTAPANLRVTGVTTTTISLAWDPVTGATGYTLWWSSSPSGPFDWWVNETADPTLTYFNNDGPFDPGQTSYYVVYAYDATDTSDPSLVLMATTDTGVTDDGYEPTDNSYPGATTLLMDTPQVHSISPAGDVDWFAISVTGGNAYVIETYSSGGIDTDTQLTLYDNSGTNQIGFNDDGGTGSYSLLEFTAGSTTTYYARVNEYSNDEAGNYVISLYAGSDPTALIDISIQ